MDDSKVFMFPGMGNTGTGNNSFDPNLMYALNNGGGMGGNWMWIIFLFFLYGWNRNGMFGGNGDAGAALGNMINNDNGRDLLMQAINGNHAAIDNLSTMLNFNRDSINSAINLIQNNMQGIANQVGMGTQQVINSVQQGTNQISQQLAQSCCDNNLAICQQTNSLMSRMDGIGAAVQQNFAQVGYNQATNTANIIQANANNTQRIIDSLNNHWQNELAQKYADTKFELSQLNQNATLIAALKGTTTGA